VRTVPAASIAPDGHNLADDLIAAGPSPLQGDWVENWVCARSQRHLSHFPGVRTVPRDRRVPQANGIATSIVIFNTMGTPMSPFEAERIVEQECDLAHAHVTHIALVLDNPPKTPGYGKFARRS